MISSAPYVRHRYTLPLSRTTRVLSGLTLALIIALGWGAASGTLGVSPWSVFNGSASELSVQVWWQLRLPRLLLGVAVGAMLAGSGAAMQGLFRNPLADPTLLGLASGAGLFVALWIVLFQGSAAGSLYGQFAAGFLGALCVCLVVFGIAKRQGGGSAAVMSLLLAGLAINTLAGAGGGVLAFIASDEQLRQLSLWGMGTLTNALWRTTALALLLISVALWMLLRSAKELDLLQLGEATAHAAGLDATRLKRRVVVATSLGVGLCVALTGVIGFLGLLVPHCLRLWLGPGHRLLLPASMLGGALLLVVADTLARTLGAPAEIPVGLLTSLLGGPYFLYLLMRRNRAC
ncbi:MULTISPECIES: FecCD family ABC transporter permease [Vreelandella]|uniref:Iron ABC transporter permease n=2 Tax=Vreelandella TaxID=3137766 RepID=A0A7C9P2U0_9GAMM|nr:MULTISPECIES: iron ABC transporter permease [Halomonas]NDL69116.1 iron ABC transporter permease [Halomonas alkaliphila]NYS44187.1 iron ABC transporter permease [Halomonas zhaodongensis]